MYIDKHLTYSLEPSSGSFSTFTAAERQWKRLLKLFPCSKYKDYCKHQNEMSTTSHDSKKAREQNLSLSKQKNMKKKRQENVRNWVAKCRALKKARVSNNASWQRQQQKQRDCFGSVNPTNSEREEICHVKTVQHSSNWGITWSKTILSMTMPDEHKGAIPVVHIEAVKLFYARNNMFG